MTFEEAIASLGTTPEEVTLKLREKGIKGSPCSASHCPIANYLKVCGFPHVGVSTYANRYPNDSHTADSLESHRLPHGVWDWIVQFDSNQYSEFRD